MKVVKSLAISGSGDLAVVGAENGNVAVCNEEDDVADGAREKIHDSIGSDTRLKAILLRTDEKSSLVVFGHCVEM